MSSFKSIAAVSALASPRVSMSAKINFPCSECNFEAQSARQLSRHKAVTHTQNALKCILCPFVTAYQTNLLRHRKDVHGICGSKGNKSCKFCGFVSDDNDALIQHQIDSHQDILKSAQVKFAKELASAGGDDTFDYDSDYLRNQDFSTGFSTKKAKKAAKMAKEKQAQQQQQKFQHLGSIISAAAAARQQQQLNDDEDDDEGNNFDDFWKTGFMENYRREAAAGGDGTNQFYLQNPMMVANLDVQNESFHESSRSSTPKSGHSGQEITGNYALTNLNTSQNLDGLPATRIRRQYTCNDCNFRTVNPREFLYHRRDGHGHRIKIVECPYCVYACQYVQKLQRHLFLVHKLNLSSELNSNGGVSGGAEGNGSGDQPTTKRKYTKRSNSEAFNVGMGREGKDMTTHEDEYEDDEAEMDENDMPGFEMNLNEFDEEKKPDDEAIEEKSNLNLECQICQIKFGDIASADKHLKKHKGQMVGGKGELKDDSNSQSGKFVNNQKKIIDDSHKSHICTICGYKTRWISELDRHVRVHSAEKPFMCNYCDFRSKWKGDLNRHLQRYHPTEMSANEIDTINNFSIPTGDMTNGGDNLIDYADDDEDETNPADLLATNYECSMEVDDHTNYTATNSIADEDEQPGTASDSVQQSPNHLSLSSTAKMFKCTYCDFMCNTASRFHVHYVQHLNTKPFQCSICGHRSNWEWDVTKHIKMKAQRDPGHAKARPVLIHDSGKRDYSKYNKFVVFVDHQLAEMAQNEANKIDFRAKRYKLDGEDDDSLNISGNGDANEVDGFIEPVVNLETDDNFVHPSKSGALVVRSVVASRHNDSRNQMISCAECEFKHYCARVIVAHMTTHSMEKPYVCKQCPFDTNWREVIISHNKQKHPQSNSSDFEMRFRCAIDEQSVCRIISLDELDQLETVSNDNLDFDNVPNFEQTFEPSSLINQNLIEPNLYEEKVVIPCKLCPFITTNQKKMDIHCRFHNPLKGNLKCKYCHYFVNNKEKLKRHQKLHNPSNEYEMNGYNNRQQALMAAYPGKAGKNASDFMRMKLNSGGHTSMGYHAGFNGSMATQSLQEGNYDDDDDLGEQTMAVDYSSAQSSVVDVNDMKNSNGGHALKKFSYVCQECPAAFKSPGDFKTHTEFHSSNYQFLCNYCSYRAKTRQQLVKHTYVHTEEYIAKRVNSYPEGTKHTIGRQSSGSAPQSNGHTAHQIPKASDISFAIGHYLSQKHKIVPPLKLKGHKNDPLAKQRKQRTKAEFPMKPVKVKLNSGENGKQKIVFNNTGQMTAQEFVETKEYLQRIDSGIKNRCMYRCSKCPAVFTKVNTLIYHMTLHDTKGAFTCGLCDYSNATEQNVRAHQLLHNLTESQTAVGYNFNYNCHKCPAGFSKRTRLEKHLSLHGAVYNWKCDRCDYSVRYAATLVKHRALHLINPNFQVMEGENQCLLNSAPAIEPSIVVNGGGLDLDDTINNNTSLDQSNLKLKLSTLSVPSVGVPQKFVSPESSDAIVDDSQEEDEDFNSLLIDDQEEVADEEEEIAMEIQPELLLMQEIKTE